MPRKSKRKTALEMIAQRSRQVDVITQKLIQENDEEASKKIIETLSGFPAALCRHIAYLKIFGCWHWLVARRTELMQNARQELEALGVPPKEIEVLLDELWKTEVEKFKDVLRSR
jgi:SOS response regulatory protein OraA/RecX